MNVGEYGVVFVFGSSYTLTGYSDLILTFTKPSGAELVASGADVTINAAERTTTAGVFAGNTYALYTFADGDVDEAGVWSVRLTFQDTGIQLISLPATFTVLE